MKKLLFAVSMALFGISANAQDFGYPSDRQFYKEHWNDVLKTLNCQGAWEDLRYVLNDFNNDGKAELVVMYSSLSEAVFARKDENLVLVSTTENDDKVFNLSQFQFTYTLPVQLLLDMSVYPYHSEREQHLYSISNIPNLWFQLSPKVEGKPGLKSFCKAMCCFDAEYISSAFYAISSGELSSAFKKFIVDERNGYARVGFTDNDDFMECCYWITKDGRKLFALHYIIATPYIKKNNPNTPTEYDKPMLDRYGEQLLFMEYDAAKKQLKPIAPPINKFDFCYKANVVLPRKGLDIKLTGSGSNYLKWNGNGFDYVAK